METEARTSYQGPVPAVARAVAILDALSQQPADTLSVSELARTLGLPKSSTANLCASLEQAGLVQLWQKGGYSLGRRLAEFGGRYLSAVDELAEFHSLCRKSRYVSQETARVAMLDGTDVLYLARYEGTQPLRLTANVGDRFPASCTATGKALLAQLDETALADRLGQLPFLPALTERSLSTMSALTAELNRVREQGWAADNEETNIGVVCLAVAVPQSETSSRALAVSATVLKARLTEELHSGILEDLASIAASMSDPMNAR